MRNQAIKTTKIGSVGNRVEVIHDADRCFGLIRRWGSNWQATWSGDQYDDHYIGEFGTKEDAILAVVDA